MEMSFNPASKHNVWIFSEDNSKSVASVKGSPAGKEVDQNKPRHYNHHHNCVTDAHVFFGMPVGG
ncbi:MAG: hypothetical protein LBJ20_06475 [Candidatus Methanoplasma sp.]|nr:hypothetical protein [Candidatus Methanoplasma sp.]